MGSLYEMYQVSVNILETLGHVLATLLETSKFDWTLDDVRIERTLNSMGRILNSIQGHSTVLCLKKEAVWL